jgi:hypothetical protein
VITREFYTAVTACELTHIFFLTCEITCIFFLKLLKQSLAKEMAGFHQPEGNSTQGIYVLCGSGAGCSKAG